MQRLAKRYGIDDFYVHDKNGRFVRSFDPPLSQQTGSIFDLCDDYRGLTQGHADMFQTPMTLGVPDNVSAKYTMRATKDRKFSMTASMRLKYFSKTLFETFSTDRNIRSIGLYSPNGIEFGSIAADGQFHQGGRVAAGNLWLGQKTLTPLSEQIKALRWRACLFSLLTIIPSFILAHMLSTRRVQNQKAESVAKLSAQVAHDIRSPLAALKATMRVVRGVTPEQREIMAAATQRIDDIANNLLQAYKSEPQATALSDPLTPAATIETLLAEKRSLPQFKDVRFSARFEESAKDITVCLPRGEFTGAFSNLINNAAEAVATDGIVAVSLHASGKDAVIQIQDNGCGMSPDVLAKALKGGTTSKAHGNGIGLSSTVERAKQWGGSLSVTSTVGVGTKILLTVPAMGPT